MLASLSIFAALAITAAARFMDETLLDAHKSIPREVYEGTCANGTGRCSIHPRNTAPVSVEETTVSLRATGTGTSFVGSIGSSPSSLAVIATRYTSTGSASVGSVGFGPTSLTAMAPGILSSNTPSSTPASVNISRSSSAAHAAFSTTSQAVNPGSSIEAAASLTGGSSTNSVVASTTLSSAAIANAVPAGILMAVAASLLTFLA